VLEAEAVQAALYAAAGEVQALMNHLGLSARSAPTAKFVFDTDLRASLRRALQFGRSDLVAVDAPLGKKGALAEPTDVVVAGKTKTPQLAVELQWHPRGEDHAGFAGAAIGDMVKMAIARSTGSVEQATVLIGAPARFWRWLPSYAADRNGYELLNAEAETPISAKADFLGGSAWDALFANGMDAEVPERLWASLIANAEVRSAWSELEVRLLEVKGLGPMANVRT
jgi:hypothetical protein